MTTLHVETAGTGVPLVFWHGWGSNLRVFDGLRASLRSEFQTIAVDLPGHGRSPWPARSDADTDAEYMLSALLEVLPPNAVLVGWSLGSQLALRAAARADAKLRALVLVNPTPRFLNSDDWSHGVDAAVMHQFADGLQHDIKATLNDFLELQLRGSRIDDRMANALRDALLAHGVAQAPALKAGLQLLAEQDLRTTARTITQPSLLIAGQYDRVTPPGAARALAELMPNVEALEIPRCGHLPFVSHSDAVLIAIRQFAASTLERAA